MHQYFPEDLTQNLSKGREEVFSGRKFYGPALDFLYSRDEDFQTIEMVDELNKNPDSRVDEYRAGNILGALRDEFELIDGYFEGGNYHWNPDLKAEGDWKDVKKELDRFNETEKPKV